MKKLLLILLTFIFLFSCKKENNADDADRYVGTYSYDATLTGGLTTNVHGSCTIAKVSAKRISLTVATTTTTAAYYTVNGNVMTEETTTSNIPVTGGGTLPFTENGSGSINGNTITIYGTDSRTGYITINFTIICTK